MNWEYLSFWKQQWDFLSHLILPIAVVTFGGLAGLSRYMRQSMLETVRQDYVQTARAKGLSEPTVIGKHALRNALLPVVTILGLSLPGADRRKRDHRVDLRHSRHGPAHGAGRLRP